METIWVRFKTYVNELPINSIFRRQDMFSAIYPNNHIKKRKENCIDHYRLYITKIGCLEHMELGHYKKKFHIPKSMTATMAEFLAYNSSWKSWFIPLEERIELELKAHEEETRIKTSRKIPNDISRIS